MDLKTGSGHYGRPPGGARHAIARTSKRPPLVYAGEKLVSPVVSPLKVTLSAAPIHRRPSIPSLTSLRFFAAAYVFVYHWAWPHSLSGWPSFLRNAAHTGYLSVSLFFVLSGFVLAYNYAPVHPGQRLDKRDFWIARFARIYPVYVLGLIIALPLFVKDSFGSGNVGRQVCSVGATATTLTQAWSPSTVCHWNCPGWAVSVEAFFYLLFPFLLIVLVRQSALRLLGIAVTSWLVSLVGPLFFATSSHAQNGSLSIVLWANPIMRLPEFLVGMAAGLIFLTYTRDRPVISARVIGRVGICAALGVAALAVASSAIPQILLRTSLATPLFAAIVFALAVCAPGGVLSSRTLILLGEASYGLYVLHLALLSYLRNIAEIAFGRDVSGSLPFLAISLAISIACSIVVRQVVEEPARRALRARFGRRNRVGNSHALNQPGSASPS